MGQKTYRTTTPSSDMGAPPARRWRDKQLPGGFTLGTYLVVEIVCTVALVTAILVMAL